MKPLAFKVRPENFDDIVGQDHLVGEKGVIKKDGKEVYNLFKKVCNLFGLGV